MRESFMRYFKVISQSLPVNEIAVLSIVLCLLAVVVWGFFRKRKGSKWTAAFFFVEYLIWIVSLVLLFRSTMPERGHFLTPFWSYRAIPEDVLMLPLVILNVLVFIPVGVLLGCAFDKMKWWKALLFGAAFSLLIEVLQYVTKRGYAEFDDVFHNTLGCLIGFGLYAAVSAVARRLSERRNAA